MNRFSLVGSSDKIVKQVRKPLVTYKDFVWFTRGDILSINYRLNGYGFMFTGLCLKVKCKSLVQLRSTFLLRNVLSRVSVEVSVAMYGLCRFSFKVLDYAKKRLVYRRSKLYYLRNRTNLETIIKIRV